jgi:flagellar biogenesis protein FliO
MKSIWLIILFASSTLMAAEPVASEKFNYMNDLINMGLTLIFVLGLAFFSLLFLKKMMRSKVRALNHGTGIKVLERRALHPKASLYLVDILGKGVVIGESATGGIQFITEFAPGTDVELLLAEEYEAQKQNATGTKITDSIQKNLAKLFKRQTVKK